VLQVLTYIGIILFLIMVVSKIIKIATAPVHLRWELYPVPHEKGKSHYGGSRLEEDGWWEKPIKKSLFDEFKAMGAEIIFLKAVWEHNRSLWLGSFPFHFALYMLFTNVILLALAGVVTLTGGTISPAEFNLGGILYYAVTIIAWVGSILGLAGAVRMYFLRIVEPGLRNFSSPSHYFNILLIGAIYLTLLMWLIMDPNFAPRTSGYYAGLMTFTHSGNMPAIAVWHICLIVFFLIYMPMTHMTHFFAKYFTYHHVRWEDAPNMSGTKMRQKLSEQLNLKVTWAAPHIGADGTKTWVALATTNPWEKKDE
ncbi:MAG: Nitrate red gam protein, partial [Bacteroidota bacterium]|nr:Nitrate red gam protein [Bacteroidota bacterium]